MWDRGGIVYSVIQQPFLYETTWFRLSALAVIGLLMAGIYRVRVGRIAHEFNVRLEDRLAERNRIARDLHDTLLQNFQGLLLRVYAASVQLPEAAPPIRTHRRAQGGRPQRAGGPDKTEDPT